MKISRILALIVASGDEALVLCGGKPSNPQTWEALLVVFPPLALIWFAEQLGSFTGYIGRGGNIDTETPGWIVAGFGWFLLLGLNALVFFG